MDPEDLCNEIENRLYRLKPQTENREPLPDHRDSLCVLLTVTDAGEWIVKVRSTGIIVNARELVFEDCAPVDANIKFDSPETFLSLLGGAGQDLPSGIACTGSEQVAGRIFDLLRAQAPRHMTGRPSPSPSKRKMTKEKVAEGTKSIKSGWLNKKRDIIAGWRHRYFKVYNGRVEYYTDQHAVVPRGVIPLIGADLSGPRRCTVNGNDDHWSITIEPRYKDKSFKLASDMRGLEGQVDMESWKQALLLASHGTSPPPSLNGSHSPSRPPQKQHHISIPHRIAAAASSLTRSASASALTSSDCSNAASDTCPPCYPEFSIKASIIVTALLIALLAVYVGGGGLKVGGLLGAVILGGLCLVMSLKVATDLRPGHTPTTPGEHSQPASPTIDPSFSDSADGTEPEDNGKLPPVAKQ